MANHTVGTLTEFLSQYPADTPIIVVTPPEYDEYGYRHEYSTLNDLSQEDTKLLPLEKRGQSKHYDHHCKFQIDPPEPIQAVVIGDPY